MLKEGLTEEELQEILRLYQLNPTHLEYLKDVIKVYDRQGVYALKRVLPRGDYRNQLLTSMQLLYQKGFRHVLPMYHTIDGRYIVNGKHYFYYLIPWVDDIFSKNERDDHYHNMLRSLAKMHKKTEQQIDIDEEQVEEHYNQIKEKWEDDKRILEQFADECEQKWYMSPFELQYCSSVYQVLRAQGFAINQLDQWLEGMKEKEKSRVCLIHGNLSIRHYVIDYQDRGYFISFERSMMAHPIQDLALFYTRSLSTYPVVRDDRFDWFNTYMKENPLFREEKKLFLSYITYPQKIINHVIAYQNKTRDWNELEYTKQFQKAVWLMNNMEYFISRVQEQQAQLDMEE
ncbi:MAG: spore coat protein YsxE [Bacillaceae bacterium]